MKVLIVDDEVIIRNGLSTVIRWSDHGFAVLPPAASAEEALQRIPLELPDIIFTDIRMTGLSGLDMAREVRQHYPEIEMIIISGYDEFAYAQQAMREGVSDYLLKTSRPDEIIAAASQARSRIAARRQHHANGKAQEAVVNRGFLRRLLAVGSLLDAASIAELWDRFPELRIEAGQFLQIWLLSAQASDQGEEDVRPASELHASLGSELADKLPCAWLEWNGYLLLLVKTGPDGRDRVMAGIRAWEECHARRIVAASGRAVSDATELRFALNSAEEAASYEWLLGRERCIRYEDIAGRRGIRTVCTQDEEAELSSLLRSGQEQALQAWIGDLLNRISSDAQATPGSVQAYLHSLLIYAQRWLERAADSIGYARPVASEEAIDIRELAKRPETVLARYLGLVMKQYGEMVSVTSPVQRAVAFIHEHLGQSLSLQQVARHVHMNPNYFSEMFKKETGQNYIEFVTQAKLRKAMVLLRETPAKISEIANAIGYEDIKYFNRLFKKWTGQTPSEYRANPEFCPSTD